MKAVLSKNISNMNKIAFVKETHSADLIFNKNHNLNWINGIVVDYQVSSDEWYVRFVSYSLHIAISTYKLKYT